MEVVKVRELTKDAVGAKHRGVKGRGVIRIRNEIRNGTSINSGT